MEILRTSLKDCFLIKPSIHRDSRGFFLESFQFKRYQHLLGLKDLLVQDNFSRSSFGTLRGLHFQKEKPQGKLVMVSMGSVLDVVVDLREGSETFSEWEPAKRPTTVVLTASNDPKLLERCNELKVHDLIGKPVHEDEFMRVVREHKKLMIHGAQTLSSVT